MSSKIRSRELFSGQGRLNSYVACSLLSCTRTHVVKCRFGPVEERKHVPWNPTFLSTSPHLSTYIYNKHITDSHRFKQPTNQTQLPGIVTYSRGVWRRLLLSTPLAHPVGDMTSNMGPDFAEKCRTAGKAVKQVLDEEDQPDTGYIHFNPAKHPEAQEVKELFQKVDGAYYTSHHDCRLG